jgi:hypothetical protein
MITPHLPQRLRLPFPFFDAEWPRSEPAERVATRPWFLVALPDASTSRDVTLGLEAIDYRVRHAASIAGVMRMVADVLSGGIATRPLAIVLAGTLDDEPALRLIDALRRVAWSMPVLVCLDHASERAAFDRDEVVTLSAATPSAIVRMVVGMSTRVEPAAGWPSDVQ